jgi:hypothetical protein
LTFSSDEAKAEEMRAALLSLVLLSACHGYDDLALLEVEQIGPPEIEPGTTLRIRGHGFPLGRDPSIRLRGRSYRPGAAPTSIEASLPGVVRSESLIEVPVTAGLIDAMGSRVTIDGEIRVAFPASDGQREVFSAERVRLDLLPDTEMQLRMEGTADSVEGLPPAVEFGLRLSREELGSAGVRIESVVPGSFADRQGIKAGDAVVELDGLSMYSWRDFVPDPSRTESTVVVAREGLRAAHVLRWPHAATARSHGPLGLVVFVFIGLLLGWASPAALALARAPVGSPLRSWLVRVVLIAGFSGLMLLVSSLHWITMWILVLGTFAALFALVTRQRTATIAFALMLGAVLSVMLLARSASIPEIVAAQSPGILRWYLLQSPVSFLAFAAYLCATTAIARSSRLSASLYVSAAAVLGAVLFLGGWPLGAESLGAAIVAGKATVILLVAATLDPRTELGVVLCGSAVVLALVDWTVDLGILFPQWSALALGLLIALATQAAVPALRKPSAPVPA